MKIWMQGSSEPPHGCLPRVARVTVLGVGKGYGAEVAEPEASSMGHSNHVLCPWLQLRHKEEELA